MPEAKPAPRTEVKKPNAQQKNDAPKAPTSPAPKAVEPPKAPDAVEKKTEEKTKVPEPQAGSNGTHSIRRPT